MAILVVGCGAIGGVFAGHLARVHEVVVWDPWVEHVNALNQKGLTLTGPGGGWTVPIPAVTEGAQLTRWNIEAVIVAVKSTTTAAAVAAVSPYVSRDAVYLSVQNGLGNEEVMAAVTGGKVAQGVTMNAGALVEPGVVRHELQGKTWYGPHTGVTLAEIAWLADVLNRSGMVTEASGDPRGAIWTKFLFNVGINPVTALTRLPSSKMVEMEEPRAMIQALIEEGKEVARRLGIELLSDPLESALRPRPPGTFHFASMAQDIFHKRSTEIDVLNGAVVAQARQLGIEAPLNLAVTRLIKGLEMSNTMGLDTEHWA